MKSLKKVINLLILFPFITGAVLQLPSLAQSTAGKPAAATAGRDSSVSVTQDSLKIKVTTLESQARLLKMQLETEKKVASQNLDLANQRQQEINRMREQSHSQDKQNQQNQARISQQQNDAGRKQDEIRHQMQVNQQQKADLEKMKNDYEKKIGDLKRQVDSLSSLVSKSTEPVK